MMLQSSVANIGMLASLHLRPWMCLPSFDPGFVFLYFSYIFVFLHHSAVLSLFGAL